MALNAQSDKRPIAMVHVHNDKAMGNSINGKNLDTAANLVAGMKGTLDPAEAQRIRCVHPDISIAVRLLTYLYAT